MEIANCVLRVCRGDPSNVPLTYRPNQATRGSFASFTKKAALGFLPLTAARLQQQRSK